MDFAGFVRGRSVALVGPSRSIGGSGYGTAIDAHDLVARINHGWPVPDRLRPDLGRRVDVLYHCCNGDRPVERVFAQGVAGLCWACFENNPDTPGLLAACDRLGIHTLDVSPVYESLRRRIGCFPNTGLVAIHHLLDAGATVVGLFGITFFREPYLDDHPSDGAAAANWPADGTLPTRIWEHDLPGQYRHFVELYRREPRLVVDEASLRVMPEVRDVTNRGTP